MRVHIWLVTALGASSLLVACTYAPRARPIIAPDGAAALHVSCGSDQGACFELAGARCPNGYRMKPIFDPASNNFLVRCEDHASVAARTGAPSTVVIRTIDPPAPAASGAPWPPPAQPWPPADPWPTGKAAPSAAPLPETARLPDGQIDIGY